MPNTLKIKKNTLKGKVKVIGAKKSALRLLAASILTDEEVFLSNFPNGLMDILIQQPMLNAPQENGHAKSFLNT